MKRYTIAAIIYLAIGVIATPFAEALDDTKFDALTWLIGILICPLMIIAGCIKRLFWRWFM